MVTTQIIINQRRNAQAVTAYLKNGINQIATEVHVVEESSTNRSEYTESQLVIAYTLNKRRELLFARFFWTSRLRRIQVLHAREPEKIQRLMRREKSENLRRIKLDCLLFSEEYMKSKATVSFLCFHIISIFTMEHSEIHTVPAVANRILRHITREELLAIKPEHLLSDEGVIEGLIIRPEKNQRCHVASCQILRNYIVGDKNQSQEEDQEFVLHAYASRCFTCFGWNAYSGR